MKLYYQIITFLTVLGVLGCSECMLSVGSQQLVTHVAVHQNQGHAPQVSLNHRMQSPVIKNKPKQETEAVHHHHSEKEDDEAILMEKHVDFYGLLKNAVKHDDDIMVQNFIDQGINIDGKDFVTGESLLHLAVMSNARKVALLLLHEHANVAVVDAQGYTPLDCAKKVNNQYMIKLLQRYSARLLQSRSVQAPHGLSMSDSVVQVKPTQVLSFS